MPTSQLVGHSAGLYLGKYGPKPINTRAVTSTGRMNPAPHISHVTMNVQVVTDEENRLDDLTEEEFGGNICVAPMISRDKNTFTTRKGDIALYRPDDYWKTSNFILNNGIQIFSSVNGLKKDDLVVPAGIVLNESASLGADKHNGDSGGVLIQSGLATTINTGPEPIPAFSTIYVANEPYIIYGPDKRPANGILWTGQSHNKLRPSTIALRSTDVYAQITSIELTVQEQLLPKNINPNEVTENELKQISREIHEEMQIPPILPIYDYVDIYIAYYWCLIACNYAMPAKFNDLPNNLQTIMKEWSKDNIKTETFRFIFNVLTKYRKERENIIKNYNKALNYSNNINIESIQKLIKLNLINLKSDESKILSLIYNENELYTLHTLTTLLNELHSIMSIIISEQYAAIRSRCIGTSTMTSEIGQQLDIVLRYFHA